MYEKPYDFNGIIDGLGPVSLNTYGIRIRNGGNLAFANKYFVKPENQLARYCSVIHALMLIMSLQDVAI